MSIYKVAAVVGGLFCFVIAGLIWITNGAGTVLMSATLSITFAVMGVVLIGVPAYFIMMGGTEESNSDHSGSAKSVSAGSSIDQKMAARRERVAAAQQAGRIDSPKEQEADGPEPLPANLKLLNIGALLFAGLGTMYVTIAQHEDPFAFAQGQPVVTSLMVCMIFYAAWRISGATARLIQTLRTPGHKRPKKKSYRSERMNNRRARYEKAKREGKI